MDSFEVLNISKVLKYFYCVVFGFLIGGCGYRMYKFILSEYGRRIIWSNNGGQMIIWTIETNISYHLYYNIGWGELQNFSEGLLEQGSNPLLLL